MSKPTRRDFLRWSLTGGAGGLALHAAAAATGLPVSFLRTGRVAHASTSERAGASPSFVVMAMNSSGDPINANCPGSYGNPSDQNDPAHLIEHATVAELGEGSLGEIAGEAFGAADFETGHSCMLGNVQTWAARPWAALPEAMRAQMAVIRHQTYTAAHPEFRKVSDFHGAVKGPGRIGGESYPSFLAQELAPLLETVLDTPMNVGAPTILARGVPVRKQKPDQLQELFAESGTWRGLTPGEFADFRDAALDDIYREVRQSGTHAQRKFLDHHARSREDARRLSEALTEALMPVTQTEDPAEKQIRTALALIEHAVTPVITIDLDFGGDNHQDAQLEVEVTETIAGVGALRSLWEGLQGRGLTNASFVYLSVFGRKLQRGSSGGRGHYSKDHAMVMFGPGVKPGLLGQVTEDLEAGPIDDIPIEETLAAAGKTFACAVGVPEDIIEERIVGGRPL